MNTRPELFFEMRASTSSVPNTHNTACVQNASKFCAGLEFGIFVQDMGYMML